MSDSCSTYKPLLTEALFGEIDEADRERLDALKALTDDVARPPTGTVPAYLYEARRDSNGYVRYQAEQMPQAIQAER